MTGIAQAIPEPPSCDVLCGAPLAAVRVVIPPDAAQSLSAAGLYVLYMNHNSTAEIPMLEAIALLFVASPDANCR
jgi:hypothetical protein